MQMRESLTELLNLESAHGIFTKFHQKSWKKLTDVDQNQIDTETYISQ